MFKIISETIGIVARSADPKTSLQRREQPTVAWPVPSRKVWPRLG
jgi:hypothetical protein